MTTATRTKRYDPLAFLAVEPSLFDNEDVASIEWVIDHIEPRHRTKDMRDAIKEYNIETRRVAKGFEYMSGLKANWYNDMDLDSFDIGDGQHCVVAQYVLANKRDEYLRGDESSPFTFGVTQVLHLPHARYRALGFSGANPAISNVLWERAIRDARANDRDAKRAEARAARLAKAAQKAADEKREARNAAARARRAAKASASS